jgi:predicted membrane chloride channel (bestrophin family)
MFDSGDFSIPISLSYWLHDNFIYNYCRSLTLFWGLLIFFIGPWSLFWYFLVNWGYIPVFTEFTTSLIGFDLVFPIFFFMYLNRSMQGYTQGVDAFAKFLFKSETLGSFIYTAIQYMDDKNKINLNSYCAELVEEIKAEIDLFLYNILTTFMPHQKFRVAIPVKLKRESFIVIPGDTVPGTMINIANIRSWILELQSHNFINSGGVHLINSQIQELSNMVESVEASGKVRDLDSIYWHTVIVIGIYLLFMIPYRLATTVGYMIFIFYPLIIFALAGVIFIRKYVGSPFRELDRFKINPMEQWYNQSIENNKILYEALYKKIKKHADEVIPLRVISEYHAVDAGLLVV